MPGWPASLVSARVKSELLDETMAPAGTKRGSLETDMRRIRPTIVGSILLMYMASVLVGCSATQHARDVQGGLEGDRLTAGTVQREITKGMSSAEVAEKLGSPNVLSTDEQGREVWIYDKFATDVVSSESGWSIFGLGGGFGNSGAGGGGVGFGGRAGASSRSQRTLTVIVKFDESKKVRDFAYHASRF